MVTTHTCVHLFSSGFFVWGLKTFTPLIQSPTEPSVGKLQTEPRFVPHAHMWFATYPLEATWTRRRGPSRRSSSCGECRGAAGGGQRRRPRGGGSGTARRRLRRRRQRGCETGMSCSAESARTPSPVEQANFVNTKSSTALHFGRVVCGTSAPRVFSCIIRGSII